MTKIIICVFSALPNGFIGGSKGGRQARAPPPGQNSFIFMQFLAKKLQNNSSFGDWRPLLGEILDPPLGFIFKGCAFFTMRSILDRILTISQCALVKGQLPVSIQVTWPLQLKTELF